MKRQYLGDSKDSFKWDYHHYLLEALGYEQLKIAWLMTPDDDSSNGDTAPELFPARQEIIRFCNLLRTSRDPDLLLGLPATTGASYSVSFHKPSDSLKDGGHNSYFSDIDSSPKQVLFIDPDNGFEPERNPSDKHVRYTDLDRVVNSISPDSIVTIFQHHRRKKFPEDFARIRERLLSGYSTAIYWHSLMFVIVSPSAEIITKVHEINCEYAKNHPVKVI